MSKLRIVMYVIFPMCFCKSCVCVCKREREREERFEIHHRTSKNKTEPTTTKNNPPGRKRERVRERTWGARTQTACFIDPCQTHLSVTTWQRGGDPPLQAVQMSSGAASQKGRSHSACGHMVTTHRYRKQQRPYVCVCVRERTVCVCVCVFSDNHILPPLPPSVIDPRLNIRSGHEQFISFLSFRQAFYCFQMGEALWGSRLFFRRM